MNNKNKIINLGCQLATMIIEFLFLLLLNIYIFIYYLPLKNNYNGNNYNKIISPGLVLIILFNLKILILFYIYNQ